MPLLPHYRINSPHVISEVIDGEAVILNFESGSYYSLNEAGKIIWEGLRCGFAENVILQHLQKRYGLAVDAVATDLSDLLKTLLSERLIEAGEGVPEAGQLQYEGPVVPYQKPVLEKFTDLQELLLLDPIHDVDESGWPHQSP